MKTNVLSRRLKFITPKEHVNMTLMIRFLVLIPLVLLVFQPIEAKQFTIKVGVDLVNVLFTVTDKKGKLISNLGPDEFTVQEDGKSQTIQHFARENELPLTLALLIDTSPSVRPIFDEEKRTAVHFLESILRKQDLALIIGFDRSVTLVQDFTENAHLLGDAVYSLDIGSGTSVYDAVYLASEEKLLHEAGRKAIIMISDGEDTTSRIDRNEALVAAHQANAVIYAISNSPPRRNFLGRRRSGDIKLLKNLSEETGGTVFLLDRKSNFEQIFSKIAEELRTQYSLGYVSTNSKRDGQYRRVKIVPRNKDLIVRARKGYYALDENNN